MGLRYWLTIYFATTFSLIFLLIRRYRLILRHQIWRSTNLVLNFSPFARIWRYNYFTTRINLFIRLYVANYLIPLHKFTNLLNISYNSICLMTLNVWLVGSLILNVNLFGNFYNLLNLIAIFAINLLRIILVKILGCFDLVYLQSPTQFVISQFFEAKYFCLK